MATDLILKSIHDMRRAKDRFEVFSIDVIDVKVKRQFAHYATRLDWVINDMKFSPSCSDELREAIDREYKCDIFTVDAINEKILKIQPNEREIFENILDRFLAGETINVEYLNEEKGL